MRDVVRRRIRRGKGKHEARYEVLGGGRWRGKERHNEASCCVRINKKKKAGNLGQRTMARYVCTGC